MKPLLRKAFFAILMWPVLTAGSCATTSEPAVRTVEVAVPIHTPCDVPEPAEPERVDTNEALREAPDIFSRVQLLLAGREQRIASEAAARSWGRACAE